MMFGATSIAVALVAGCATTQRFARLDAELAGQTQRGDFSGVVLVARHGVAELARAYGRELTMNTCFNLASASKLFTLVAIEQLLERGEIRADGVATARLWCDQYYERLCECLRSKRSTELPGFTLEPRVRYVRNVESWRPLDRRQ